MMSSHTNSTELAPHAAWYKSSYSGSANDSCVEVANLLATRSAVGVRDSKQPAGPALLVGADGWTALIHAVRETHIQS